MSDIDVPVARTSERGAATRTALLAAAREVFTAEGFAQAGVTDVVARAGASVGSLYHHFSGKADLYLSLYEEFQRRQQERTRRAVQEARAEGCTDPQALLISGCRAYFDGCIEERDLARLFVIGDGPPGFELIMRRRLREWADRNMALFRRSEESVDEALVLVLTGAMVAAVTEVALGDDEERARRLADEVLVIMSGIGNPRRR